MSQVCFDSSTFYTVLIISVSIFVYCLLDARHNTKVKYIRLTMQQPLPSRQPSLPPAVDESIAVRNFETERFLHPMVPPLRRGPLNLGPRGLGHRYGYGPFSPFNQMGYLHNPDNNEQAMPLMGRRLHSQQYEYYTFHHNNPDIKIPIKIQGDKEIMDGDQVSVPTYNGQFSAKIYELDTPRYVPY